MSGIVHAQGFDSITHPDDFSVQAGDEISITWVVTIDSVGSNPTYDVFRDGVKFISAFTWNLEGGEGTIIINPPTDLEPKIYNITIVVNDGLGNTISDEVWMTIIPASAPTNIWVYVAGGVILGLMLLIMTISRNRIAKKVETQM
ncbi:MAG: hypothetical protein JW776_08315 [Candidatus Lokiarchaeota archaeon]|nr:hypothetical protein [Candidatus Lokiarchaeota archaeon]